MRRLMRILGVGAMLFQAACTAVVWNGGVYDADRAIETRITHAHVQDKIRAFGRTPTGQLLMMGETYWYAIRHDAAHDLQRVLQAQLPAHYQLTAPYHGNKLSALPIVVHENQQFSSQFCLDYVIQHRNSSQQQVKENHVLKQMGFQQQINPNRYRKCFATVGSLHAAPQQWQHQTHSDTTHIAVELQIEQRHIQIQSDKLTRNILLTPLALVADVAGGLVMLPALILGDLLE